MIEKLYSDFDSDITIRSNEGKTFPETQIDVKELSKIEGVKSVSRAIEEIVVVKHEKKLLNARLIGVDEQFLNSSQMESHLIEGKPFLRKENIQFALIGASLLDKLEGYIPKNVGYEQVILYAPKRNAKMRLGSNPFTTQLINLSGRYNYNREVNAETILVTADFARELLNYNSDITAVYVEVDSNYSNDEVKEHIKTQLGKGFEVKTNFEKNELIFKTSKSEKFIVLIILVFIFILAAFNLIASLTMLFVEKLENIKTMISFGANQKTVFRIFFLEGLLISGKGILIGGILGYAICFLQVKTGLLSMPNSGGEAFPIRLSFWDGALIFFLVSFLSFLFSYLPVRYLIKKNFSHLKF